jgi:quinolinate synthase
MDEVQAIADVVGDSLDLSKYCAKTDKKVIVFCGVHFMAESAKILAPDKEVLLPEIDAGCPMADMITPESLAEEKKKNPDYLVLCYINSSAKVKAESDVCCTSSNAVKVARQIDNKNILFVPDMNLGNYVKNMVPEKNFKMWNGFCITHYRVEAKEVRNIKLLHPDAMILVHPECQEEVIKLADFVGSTKQIIDYASQSNHTKFIIGTEMGVLYKLKNQNPNKTFYLMSQGLVCPNMKKTSLQSIYDALNEDKYKIEIDDDVRFKAKYSLDKMFEYSD